MIPVLGANGWFFMPLPPTKFASAKLAKFKVTDGHIVHAVARERTPDQALQILHWASVLGSWTESA